MQATVAHSYGDEPDLCPYCGGEWEPPQAVAEQGRWVVVPCTMCDATKMTASGVADPPPTR
jgi:hypothetical protein